MADPVPEVPESNVFCMAQCDIEGQSQACTLDEGHEHEHEANVVIIAGPDDTETTIIVFWSDEGDAFVGCNKAVNTGRIG